MRQPSEAEIANALAGHFYRVTRDGEVVDCMDYAAVPTLRVRPSKGRRSPWSEEEHARMIQLYRDGTTWERLTAMMGRNHKLIRDKVKVLVAQGVLEPRRTGRRRKVANGGRA